MPSDRGAVRVAQRNGVNGMAQRQMHLGVFVLGTGNHIAGWRMPGAYDSFQSLPVIVLK